MDRLVPKEQSTELRALLDRCERRYPSNEGFADVKKHLTGELHEGGIRSAGTSREQAEFAARNPHAAELQFR